MKLRAASVNSKDISIGNGVPGIKIGFPHIIGGAGKDGRLVTCGASAGANPQTDVQRKFWKYLKVFGSTLGTREDFRRVLNFLSPLEPSH